MHIYTGKEEHIKEIGAINEEIKEIEGRAQKMYRELATRIFIEKIKPFLIKRNLNFISGMGAFLIYTKKGKAIYLYDYPSLEFIRIFNILSTEYDSYNNILGGLMPDLG